MPLNNINKIHSTSNVDMTKSLIPVNGVEVAKVNLLPFEVSRDVFANVVDFFFRFCFAPWPFAWSLLTILNEADPL